MHTPRKNCHFRWLFLAVCALVLCGCGGGGKTANSGSSGNNNNGSGGSLAFTQRKAALDAIASQFSALSGQDLAADSNTLLAYVKTRSEFEASGLSSIGGVWARFKDGRLLIISNNRQTTPPGKAASLRLPQTPTRVPAGNSSVQLLVDDGNIDTATAVALGNDFKAAGYSGAVQSATLDNLRALSNVGVLYIDAHCGTVILRDGSEKYGLMTSSLIEDTVDQTLAADLESNAVGYMMAPSVIDLAGQTAGVKQKITNNYFITDEFVKAHISFANNSVVFINACSSNGTKGAAFASAFTTKNAGVYLGWTKDIDDKDAQETARYLFDRLLGEMGTPADYNPESPPQRPFPINDVLQVMGQTDRSDGHPGKLTDSAFGPESLLNLTIEPLTDGIICHLVRLPGNIVSDPTPGLAPDIYTASIAKDKVTLMGNFGGDANVRKVFVGGQDMTAQSALSASQIVVSNIPNSGAGSNGDVYVTVRGVKSNVVQITDWRGTFVVCQFRQGMDNGAGEKETLNYSVHLRAILNPLRLAPKQQAMLPFQGKLGGLIAPDGSCMWDASGQYVSGGVTETIARVGSPDITFLPFGPNNPMRQSNFLVALDLTTNPAKMQFSPFAQINDDGGLQITQTDSSGSSNSFKLGLNIDFTTDDTASLDANYNIVAGQWKDPNGIYTVQWNAIPATSPPDPNGSRAAQAVR